MARISVLVKVANRDGRDVLLPEVALASTVLQLKQRLQEELPFRPTAAQQKLVYHGRLLADDLVLKDTVRRVPAEEEDGTPVVMHLVVATDSFSVAPPAAPPAASAEPVPVSPVAAAAAPAAPAPAAAPASSSARPASAAESPVGLRHRTVHTAPTVAPAAATHAPGHFAHTAGLGHYGAAGAMPHAYLSPQQYAQMMQVYSHMYGQHMMQSAYAAAIYGSMHNQIPVGAVEREAAAMQHDAGVADAPAAPAHAGDHAHQPSRFLQTIVFLFKLGLTMLIFGHNSTPTRMAVFCLVLFIVFLFQSGIIRFRSRQLLAHPAPAHAAPAAGEGEQADHAAAAAAGVEGEGAAADGHAGDAAAAGTEGAEAVAVEDDAPRSLLGELKNIVVSFVVSIIPTGPGPEEAIAAE